MDLPMLFFLLSILEKTLHDLTETHDNSKPTA